MNRPNPMPTEAPPGFAISEKGPSRKPSRVRLAKDALTSPVGLSAWLVLVLSVTVLIHSVSGLIERHGWWAAPMIAGFLVAGWLVGHLTRNR